MTSTAMFPYETTLGLQKRDHEPVQDFFSRCLVELSNHPSTGRTWTRQIKRARSPAQTEELGGLLAWYLRETEVVDWQVSCSNRVLGEGQFSWFFQTGLTGRDLGWLVGEATPVVRLSIFTAALELFEHTDSWA